MNKLREATWEELQEQLEKVAERSRKCDEGQLESVERLAHELHVYQIELEMQNRELRESQQQLEETRDRYADLYDFAPVGYVTLDTKGNIREINLTGATILGRERIDILGKPLGTWVAKECKPAFFTHLKRVFASREMVVDDLKIEGSKRPECWVSLHSERAPDGGGEQCRTAMSDISDRKKAEDALKKHEEHLEELVAQRTTELKMKNEELQHFARITAHDLQEPLRMVSGFLKLLAKRYKGKLDSDADEFIDFAVDGASRMQQMIDDLLNYACVGMFGNLSKPVDTTAVFDNVIGDLQAAVTQSGAVITRDPLPTLVADKTQLYQLLLNLIGNAIKFKSSEPPRVHVSAQRKDDEWVFSVTDNGMGIAPQFHTQIFEAFRRLHTMDEYPGSGLGLATCKKITDNHNGRIWVDSEAGKGATFYFTIPIHAQG